MIICHPLRLIFIKTKKVGGTSFEIALSQFCEDTCVITPITPQDELTRHEMGARGPQNHDTQTWPDGSQTQANLYNHICAAELRRQIPADIWDSYTKVTIYRDPFDAIISRYYWEALDRTNLSFGDFVHRYRGLLSENRRIAPLEGADTLDVYLRYEHLQEDIAALGIDGLWESFSALKAKGDIRPKTGTDPATVFADYPAAAGVVSRQCAPEIKRFGYMSPIDPTSAPATPQPAVDQRGRSDFIFTLSAGRTGTAWLAKLLGENLGIQAQHEPLGVDDFGRDMPEIRHMRTFNTLGFEGELLEFWTGKFERLVAPYAEANHTLGKCGLIEALAGHSIADRSTVVILRRDLAKQCASYVNRNDFQNITIAWQWYLDLNYPNAIVNPEIFRKLGQIGAALWYTLEMETRQAYYQIKYADRVRFVEARLEEVTTPAGAAAFLAELGHSGPVTLPAKANAMASDMVVTDQLTAEIRKMISNLNFNAEALARNYLRQGRSLDAPTLPRAVA